MLTAQAFLFQVYDFPSFRSLDAGDEAFQTGDDHELIGDGDLFAGHYLVGEDRWDLQVLVGGSVQTVALGVYLVFNDDRRHTQALKPKPVLEKGDVS